MKKKGHKRANALPKAPRVHRVSFLLNDDEFNAVCNHFSKYKISNKSRWYRETIFSQVLKTLEEDYPTLFNESEMRG
ncbi:hypothetical protein M2459_002646 [Parabacteroides sp. PF5-5]|uniref:hypothetical protein n=1 Tax=unclassified Parabacteroides TaxID=2649774 RepID=UPI002473DC66|nr:MULTISPECIES: hypothetical protein [unclassified Parabacteroides]MDH6306283.1 hypothetical protein [Parabacteroides sp. PH5-39]MDH6316926.1 hypothetical protein [Parabacteroides sp. PF5-13]MDH6320995.1 hypothetical protein [Parabacteroides sp. PH5-13]MDH6324727.1 hypothetical protein [Parabacteroides sp. PH5-8]MDH6328111.1 hypothetical protein [Parabacteroides sp. PH5-41]